MTWYKVTIPSNIKYVILHESPWEVSQVRKFLPKEYYPMATIWHFMKTSSTKLDIDVSKWELLWKLDSSKKQNIENIWKAIEVVKKNGWKVILATDADREWAVIAHSIVEYFKLKPGEYLMHKDPWSLIEKEYMKNLNESLSDYDKNMAEAWITRQILDKYVWFEVTEHLWNVSSKYKSFLEDIKKEIQEKIEKFEKNNKEVLETNEWVKKAIQVYKDLFIEDKKDKTKEEEEADEKRIKKWEVFESLEQFDNRKGTSFWRVQTVSLILLVLKEFEKFEKELDRKVNIQAKDKNDFLWEYSKNVELETNIPKMREIYDIINNAFKDKKIKSIKVKDIESKIQKKTPPTTLDTIAAQKWLSSQFWYNVKSAMKYLQTTYESWLTTYMRTDTNATTAEYDEYFKWSIQDFWENYVYRKYTIKGAQEGHIWILPTQKYDVNKLMNEETSKLTKEEFNVFEYVVRRTLAAFMDEAQIEYFTYTLEVKWEGWKEEFILKDSNIIKEWYLSIFTYELGKYKQKVFYKKWEEIDIKEFIWKEKDIKLPGWYNETSFIEELKKNWIWRPSTYASIIETLKEKNYIKMSGSKIEVTPKWFWVYKVVTTDDKRFWRFKNVNFTVKMEEWLDLIAQWKINRNSVLNWVKREIDEFKTEEPKKEVSSSATNWTSLWKCPSCWKWEIVENAKAYGCTNWKVGCKFTIWKETMWHTFSLDEVSYMIKNKESQQLTFKSKAWKDFNAKLVFDKKKWFQFEFIND